MRDRHIKKNQTSIHFSNNLIINIVGDGESSNSITFFLISQRYRNNEDAVCYHNNRCPTLTNTNLSIHSIKIGVKGLNNVRTQNHISKKLVLHMITLFIIPNFRFKGINQLPREAIYTASLICLWYVFIIGIFILNSHLVVGN